jgi:hypothetical protein
MTVARRSGRHRPAGAHGRWLVIWLAVLAVVTQTVLFDLAMAARMAAVAGERAELAQHAHHGAPKGGPEAPAHEHGGKDCPFCIARAMHQAPSPPPVLAVLPPSSAVALATYAPPVRIRARRRPIRFRPRAPPSRLRY